MNRSRILLLLLLAGMSGLILISFQDESPSEESLFKEAFKKQYGVYALAIPVEMEFAGEPVPFHMADVYERYDRELLVNTYWQSQTLLFFKRANRWFPLIEEILARHGVPEDFKYLALIESGLMHVVSPAGATGYWQILEGTAKDLGLEVNRYVDERYHIEKSTEAACKYLLDAYNRFGSWTLAAAAYNIGNARLSRILNTQQVSCYYDLHLNEETSRYIFRLLAIKSIFDDPAASGFHFRKQDLYQPFLYHTLEVDTPITDLVAFARFYETTYKELRILNPWIRDYELPNRTGKKYLIKLPLAPLDTLH